MLLSALAATLDEVAGTRARRAKAGLVAGVLRQAGSAERAVVVRYLEGELPQRRTGLGWRSLGELPAPAAAPSLAVLDVDVAMAAAARESGSGSTARRRQLLHGLLAACTAPEQRLVAGLVSGELRQGAQRGVLVEALAAASGAPVEAVRRALTLTGDVVEVAQAALGAADPAAAGEALAATGLRLGRPVSPMLASSAPTVAQALARTGLASVEWKLDGVRVQVHRDGDDVRVWTRTLEEVTDRLPEVVAAVSGLPARTLVLDGEVLGLHPGRSTGTAPWRGRRPVPFQETSARVASRGADAAARRLELALVLFDVLHRDGEDLLDARQDERRAVLEQLAPDLVVPGLVVDPEADEAAAVAAAESVARDALARGHEGVVVKAAGTTYAAGRRGAGWVKVKPRLTLDLVVLAAERGSGRRTGTLSNLHLGARDPSGRFGPPGSFVMLGKTFKGLTDAMLAWQTEHLASLTVREGPGQVDVRPELVVEIALDGVQTSSSYPAGMALRFARVVAHRPDKPAAEADPVEAVEELHAAARRAAADEPPSGGGDLDPDPAGGAGVS